MSETDVSRQLWQMAQMFLAGWMLMLSAHEKQALARRGRWSYRQKMLGDFLFCLMWALLLWLILLAVSGGLVRNYIIIGFLGGAAVYWFICRRRLERFCLLLAGGILFVWRWFWRVVWMPWRVLHRFCVVPCMKFVRKFVKEKQEFAIEEENIIENENYFLS
ncbi:MAG: hypothetical protein IKU46_00620 [Peptococcaceae bacterium]|nr:hypothetical protein [Peptococcaceae bacterium]